MATHRVPVLGPATIPDTSGSVFAAPYTVYATNDAWRGSVFVFADTATRIGLHGRFSVPRNYVGTPSIVIEWTSTATSGNVVWDVDYRAIGGDNAESFDQATAQQSVTVTDAAPTAAHNRLEVSVAITAANLAIDDTVEFILYRDGADAADTMAAAALLFGVYLQYADV